jgi:predicted secreted protein
MAIRGKDFIFYIIEDGTPKPVCYATDCLISQQAEVREITGPTGRSRDYIGGKKGYNITVPGLILWRHEMNYLQLENLYKNRVKFQWEASDSENGGVKHSGTALITQLDLSSQFRDAMRFDMSAIGCGDKQTSLNPITVTVYLADFLGVRLPGCPNPYPVSLYWYDETFIGIANTADEVITQFNEYAANEYYELTGVIGGCDFNMSVEWDAPFVPEFIIAEATPNLGMWEGNNDNGISNDQDNDNLISPAYA